LPLGDVIGLTLTLIILTYFHKWAHITELYNISHVRNEGSMEVFTAVAMKTTTIWCDAV
jgi:hypothetical protein